jgi:aldose 1-epimerase
MKSILFCLLVGPVLAATCFGQNYTARETEDHGVPIVRLADLVHHVEVNIAPSIGNRAYEMKVNGQNILDFPFADMAAFRERPGLCGIPFLAPWANRLGEQAFWANDKKYVFNMGLGNVRGAIPIHGFLSASPEWKVTEVKAGPDSASVTSRLEFWRYPDMMAQWPFAHEYEMTYSLSNGTLEVRLAVSNLSREAMPLAIGFHPYYKIPGIPRDQWTAHIPARKHVEANQNLPTGEFTPNSLPDGFSMQGHTFDDGFTDLVREPDGRAHFSVESAGKRVEAMFGPKYPVAVVWAPTGRNGAATDFICFEPMAGITNGVNLAHDGKYRELQSVPAGGKWVESFWVRASGM